MILLVIFRWIPVVAFTVVCLGDMHRYTKCVIMVFEYFECIAFPDTEAANVHKDYTVIMKRNWKYISGALIAGVLLIAFVGERYCGNSVEPVVSQPEQQRPQWKQTAAGAIPFDSIGRSVNTDESERSDRLSGGRIEQTPLTKGDPRIWLSVDIPAFRLTLWQGGREVKTYQIGIGRRSFPLPVGEREAAQIVWNPEWIPPDSSWVQENEDLEPGERIEADDLRNPLGKIKIPLGRAILIHEARTPADIGGLVSHGCVRMRTADIFDLAEKIVQARSMPVTHEQIERAKLSTERLSVKLEPPLWVDIDYDTEVVEGGVLSLYPDVYNRIQNPVAALRQELLSFGVDAAMLDDQMLKQMLGRVTMHEMFSVSLADIKAGRALSAGRQQRLVSSFQFPGSSPDETK